MFVYVVILFYLVVLLLLRFAFVIKTDLLNA